MPTAPRLLDGTPLEAHSVLFLALRRLRLPLMVIVLAYASSVFGFTLIAGVTPDGVPTTPMSFFHAFYFVSYTATTIGFGEVPQAFSDAQRMWTMVVIHLTVVSWTFALLNVLALFQDHGFQRAVAQIRFAGRVRRMREPFHLICGAGDSGQRLVRLLDRLHLRVVVVEGDRQRVDDLELEDLSTDVPVLHAEVGLAQTLLTAGLRHPMCRAVLAITSTDESNLAVVTAVRLLNRRLPVIAGAESPHTVENMCAFEPYKVISPFETFADNLLLAMRAPGCYRLLDWLTAPPDAELEKEHEPPRGAWVICGHGRFGTAVSRSLIAAGLRVTAIDPAYADSDPDPPEGVPIRVRGAGTERAVLERAAIGKAAGLVVATDNDITNLAIAALARTLNPTLFVVLRQNDAVNRVLFDSFHADLVMRASEIIADECVALLTTPLLDRFLAIVREHDDAWADEVIDRLRERVGTRSPQIWALRIDDEQAPAVCERLAVGPPETPVVLPLGDLLREPGDRQAPIAARAVLLLRDGRDLLMPSDELPLKADDRILFVGRGEARRRQALSLFDANVLRYVCTGRDTPGGWLFTRRPAGGPSPGDDRGAFR